MSSNSTSTKNFQEDREPNVWQHQQSLMTALRVLRNPDGSIIVQNQNPVILTSTPEVSLKRKIEMDQFTQISGPKKIIAASHVDMEKVNRSTMAVPSCSMDHEDNKGLYKPVAIIVSQDGTITFAEVSTEIEPLSSSNNSTVAPYYKSVEYQDNEVFDEPIVHVLQENDGTMKANASVKFDWRENYDTFEGVAEVFAGPTPGAIKDYDSPTDAFKDIWDNHIVEILVREVNKHAETVINLKNSAGTLKHSSRMHRWHNTNIEEMYLYFAISLVMDMVPLTPKSKYWNEDLQLDMPKFVHLMTYNRFVMLKKFLHFNDNADASQDFKRTEILPVLRHLETKFQSLYNLQKYIEIKHSLTLLNGKLSWVKPKKSKEARFGVQILELCEAGTGYVYKFGTYTEKTGQDAVTPCEETKIQIILDLLKDLDRGGHCVTINNSYYSPLVARCLKIMGFDCSGIIDPKSNYAPNDVKKALKNTPKGAVVARYTRDLSCIAWKNESIVAMISTSSAKAERKLKSGVDLNKEGEKHFFKRLLNISINNAIILASSSLQRRNIAQDLQYDFRHQLAHMLVAAYRPSLRCLVVPVEEDIRLRRDVVHVPKYFKPKRCHMCSRNDIRRNTRMKCVTCDEFMCDGDCWYLWHYVPILPGRPIKTRKSRRT